MLFEAKDVSCEGAAGYFSVSGGSRTSGVLLLPSIHGREPYLLAYMRFLVERGFPTLLWDVFPGKGEAATREERTARGSALSDAGSFQQMSALVNYMFHDLGMTHVAVLGFCLGGRFVLTLGAREPRLAGLVSYYPTIEDPRLPSQEWDAVSDAAAISCPVQLIAPGRDHITHSSTYERLHGVLKSRAQPTIVQFFPEAEHAFLQERRVGRANRQAGAISRELTVAFLKSVLRTETDAHG